MIVLALELAIITIVAFCGWRGYKNGLIRGVFGVVSLIVSLFLASVAATAYSKEFTEILSPFVGGIVDSALVAVMEESDEEAADINAVEPDDIIDEPEDAIPESENYSAAYNALKRIGLPESSSTRIAAMSVEGSEYIKIPTVLLSDMIAEKLSSVLSFVAIFGIAFILLAIIFTVIGNLVGVVFSLPGLKLLDTISGAVFGVLKGLIIVFALATVARYAGLLAPDILDSTTLLKYLVNNNPIANRIGI